MLGDAEVEVDSLQCTHAHDPFEISSCTSRCTLVRRLDALLKKTLEILTGKLRHSAVSQ